MDGWMQRSTVDQRRAKMLSIIKGSNDGAGRVLDTTWRIDRELKSRETIARSRAVVEKKSGGAAREGADVRGKTATADAGVCRWSGEAGSTCVEERRNKQTIDASTSVPTAARWTALSMREPETGREARRDGRERAVR